MHMPNPPVHVLSALLVLALDWLWTIPELATTFTVIGPIVLSMILAVVAATGVFSVQKFVVGDNLGEAFAKAFVMGIIAGVPYAVIGTVVSGPLLAWGGIKQLTD
ncbi:MAG: hypothetical protein HC822_13400 [Oscillochloris sp.]|nr:hypothetical protein [Oscillochloris sp.]